jgi:hypothetical protein
LLDQLASASGDDLESQLAAAVSGTNPDSDLYATQFNLKLSSPSSTEVVLTSNASTQTTAIVSAAAEALPATTAAAFGGNTQLSREELQAGAMPAAAPAAASMRAMQPGLERFYFWSEQRRRWNLEIWGDAFAEHLPLGVEYSSKHKP